MDNVVGFKIPSNIVDVDQTIFNDLPNNTLTVKNQSDLNGITLRTAISEDSCLFARYLGTDTTAGYYSTNQVVKETPVNNQLSVKIRKKIKIRCSL